MMINIRKRLSCVHMHVRVCVLMVLYMIYCNCTCMLIIILQRFDSPYYTNKIIQHLSLPPLKR